MKRFFTLVLFLIGTQLLLAQSDLAIGQWRSHLPYQFGRYVTQSETTIYYATDWSILTIDKEENAIDFISTVNGLSKTGVGIIKYHPPTETLLITYDEGIIDLLSPNEIVTLTDIKNFVNLTIDKTINDIFVAADGKVYIAAGYGISVLNVDEQIFEFTTFSGVSINSVVQQNGILYAATGEGIYFSALDNPVIQDFNSWNFLGTAYGLPDDYKSQAMTIWQGELYFDMDNKVYQLEGTSAKLAFDESLNSITYLTAEDANLLVGTSCLPNCDGELYRIKPDGTINTPQDNCVDRPLYAIEDAQGKVWFADRFRGVRVAGSFASNCSKEIYNSPYSHLLSEMTVFENKLYVAAGGLKENGQNQFRRDGLFTYIDGTWTRISEGSVKTLRDQGVLFDYYRLAVRPTDGHVFVGTYTRGLFEYNGEEGYTFYDEDNSSLGRAERDTNNVRVGGIAFDRDQNLWVGNHSATRPISVLKADGTWKNFSVPQEKTLLQTAVDQLGYKWFVVAEVGLLVFDDGGTIDDISDDRYKYFRQNNSTLPTSIINCIEVDKDGKVWVGTTDGVVVYECDPFNDECVGGLPIVGENEVDDEDEYLLKGEDVRSIAVNGANQKWFGTTNGVFLQSENGRRQLAFFNESSSPLPDNTVIDIAIDDATGEIYFGTNKGIISYRGRATDGQPFNDINAYAFPNPVRPEYDGPIAIKGLAENANVKITDITGQLIFETEAEGGQAIWDGRDYNGRRASSGVYLVFSTKVNLNNPDTLVTKILFIN